MILKSAKFREKTVLKDIAVRPYIFQPLDLVPEYGKPTPAFRGDIQAIGAESLVYLGGELSWLILKQ